MLPNGRLWFHNSKGADLAIGDLFHLVFINRHFRTLQLSFSPSSKQGAAVAL
jgi:hypothetical protein